MGFIDLIRFPINSGHQTIKKNFSPLTIFVYNVVTFSRCVCVNYVPKSTISLYVVYNLYSLFSLYESCSHIKSLFRRLHNIFFDQRTFT